MVDRYLRFTCLNAYLMLVGEGRRNLREDRNHGIAME